MFCFNEVCMYWFIGKGVKNPINIMVEATAVHTIDFTCLESCNNLEMRCLSFLIWVFLYCRNVFSLLLRIMFSRSVMVGSSSFCCKDVLVLAISVWRWLFLIFVHLILLWISEHSAFFIMACSNLLPFHFDLQVFWFYFIC